MASTRRSKKNLSPRKIRNLKALAERIDREEGSSIRARARSAFTRHEQVRSIVEALRLRRLELGMSLAAVARSSGIAKPNLSRLENSRHAAPTLDTLERYARAVGLTIRIELGAADAA